MALWDVVDVAEKAPLEQGQKDMLQTLLLQKPYFFMDISVVVQCKVEVCDSMNSPTKSPEEGDWIRLNLLQRGRT